jgi:hypothetical protein
MIAAAALVSVVAGCRLPSERIHYRIACEAVRSQPGVPGDVKLPGIGDARIYVEKNAGQVVLDAEYAGERGENLKVPYVVWTRRVARTWTLERCSRGACPHARPSAGRHQRMNLKRAVQLTTKSAQNWAEILLLPRSALSA